MVEVNETYVLDVQKVETIEEHAVDSKAENENLEIKNEVVHQIF